MNRKGPWEGYRRQAKRRLARCLLPAFLCAHVLKRDVWVRGRSGTVFRAVQKAIRYSVNTDLDLKPLQTMYGP